MNYVNSGLEKFCNKITSVEGNSKIGNPNKENKYDDIMKMWIYCQVIDYRQHVQISQKRITVVPKRHGLSYL